LIGYCPICRATRDLSVDNCRPLDPPEHTEGVGTAIRRRWSVCPQCGSKIRTLEVIEAVEQPEAGPEINRL
jgi:transcriptional regulator NrdR family protein